MAVDGHRILHRPTRIEQGIVVSTLARVPARLARAGILWHSVDVVPRPVLASRIVRSLAVFVGRQKQVQARRGRWSEPPGKAH
jgi:hypothetical protein